MFVDGRAVGRRVRRSLGSRTRISSMSYRMLLISAISISCSWCSDCVVTLSSGVGDVDAPVSMMMSNSLSLAAGEFRTGLRSRRFCRKMCRRANTYGSRRGKPCTSEFRMAYSAGNCVVATIEYLIQLSSIFVCPNQVSRASSHLCGSERSNAGMGGVVSRVGSRFSVVEFRLAAAPSALRARFVFIFVGRKFVRSFLLRKFK